MTLEQLLPEAKKFISDKVVYIFKEQGAKAAFAKLYTFLPIAIRLFVKEEAFINFCMQHQDKLFGNQKPVTKESKVKKVAVKKVVKKAATKKIAVKKAAPKKVVAKKVVNKAAVKKVAAKKSATKKK